MSVKELYVSKRMSASEAVRMVHNGDSIIVPTGVGEPPTLLTVLSDHRREFQDVKVAQILPLRKYAYIDPETVDHVRHVALFYGAATRPGGKEGWVDFIPNYFSEIPLMIERGLIPADVVFSMASPMDAHGWQPLPRRAR
jgi:acyl-CoA hydrolase